MRDARALITAGALVAAALLAAGPDLAEARPKCFGKKATRIGGKGANVLKGGKRRDKVVGRGGDDRIVTLAGADRICAGKGDDVIIAGAQPDLIRGGPGDDVIYGGTGADVIYGGPGRDLIFGDAGSDRVRGGNGADRLFGGLVDDRLRGSGGDDLLVGGHGGDGLAGGAGDDWMRGGANRDGFFGGPGSDTVSFATATPTSSRSGQGGVTVNLNTQLASGEGQREFVRKVENVLGSPFADTIDGSRAPNRIEGGFGDDKLRGLGGADTSVGGPGSDVCTSFEAADPSCNDTDPRPAGAVAALEQHAIDPGLIVFGRAGAGADSIRVDAGGVVVVRADGPIAPGPGCVAAGSDASCPVDPRRVGYVSIAGLGGNDRLSAGGRLPRRGEVQLDGGRGDDRLVGTRGDDVLLAGPSGRDLLLGGRGSDALISAAGRDVLRGGPGSDQLVTDDPCGGHVFAGGPGKGDIAGFARAARARLHARRGGKAVDVRKARCHGTKVRLSNEILEGTRNSDVLIGTKGNDPLILGGKGRDLLRAKDGRRDKLIDCGAGSDFVKRDKIDPPPKRCRPPKEQRRKRGKP